MLSEESFHRAYSLLRKVQGDRAASELACCQFRRTLADTVNDEWTNSIAAVDEEEGSAQSVLTAFDEALNIFGHSYERFKQMCTDETQVPELCLQIKVVIFPILAPKLLRVLERVFQVGFDVYSKLQGSAHLGEEQSDACHGCGKELSSCCCHHLLQLFRSIIEKMGRLHLLDRLANHTAVRVAFGTVEKKVKNVYISGDFSSSHLDDLVRWLRGALLPWLGEMCANSDALHRQTDRLEAFLFDSVGRRLISQLFDIVVDFPDSSPALQDLTTCLDRALLRAHLTDSLQRDVSQRLLHIGVNTDDVLNAYTSAVKSLRILDPSGVIMQAVCQPIRQYLRNRTDTVRCIVSFLTDQRQDELGAELCKREGLALDDPDADPDDADDFDLSSQQDWTKWSPDPVDAPVDDSRRSRRSADLISMLIGVYGSKDLFVKEYRQLLSERLLKSRDHDIDAELRYLEMLKIRFGETELQQCEVMLKDIKDSARIDDFAAQHQNLPFSVSVRILSAHFWPKQRDERLTLPDALQLGLASYNQRFQMLKASRTLEWIPSMGSVEVQLEIDERDVILTVSPALAAIIWLFQEKETWTTDELSARLTARSSTVRRRAKWWQIAGLLEQRPAGSDTWTLCSSAPSTERMQAHAETADSDSDDEQSRQESDVDALEMYWTYVSGLLANLDSLKTERVHSLLSMVSSPGQQGPTLETVNAFLQRKVKQNLLIFSAGAYKAPRK
uniref:Anaphase-promoting complex subunit 2 n=1 Tax=Plectus sambesii TaxID=2011161 RepID=A0A914UZ69_9BILA